MHRPWAQMGLGPDPDISDEKRAPMTRMPSEFDETRAVARLPSLDIDIVRQRSSEGDEELLQITIRAVPSFEAVGKLLTTANPMMDLLDMGVTAAAFYGYRGSAQRRAAAGCPGVRFWAHRAAPVHPQ
jgi:hypothetical protein